MGATENKTQTLTREELRNLAEAAGQFIARHILPANYSWNGTRSTMVTSRLNQGGTSPGPKGFETVNSFIDDTLAVVSNTGIYIPLTIQTTNKDGSKTTYECEIQSRKGDQLYSRAQEWAPAVIRGGHSVDHGERTTTTQKAEPEAEQTEFDFAGNISRSGEIIT